MLETPLHGAGQLMRGGNYGNRGGRRLSWAVLDELERRIEAAHRAALDRATLDRLPKETLVEMLAEMGEWITLSTSDLRQILDTAAKDAIGTKHVHSGDEDDLPVGSGVVILPPLNTSN